MQVIVEIFSFFNKFNFKYYLWNTFCTYLNIMKHYLFLSALFISVACMAQENTFPKIDIHTLESKTFNTNAIENNGQPIVISFWATWCKPCVRELNTISELYEDWQEETGVKLYAVSIDDSRNIQKLAPFVATSDWPFDVLSDVNSDFRRAMNVVTSPHTFLLDENRKIVWQHVGYSPGDEDELYEQLLKLAGK